jgi:hypothetical protein
MPARAFIQQAVWNLVPPTLPDSPCAVEKERFRAYVDLGGRCLDVRDSTCPDVAVRMTAIQIRVNGKLVATCGPGVLRQLVAMVAAQRPPQPPHAGERTGTYSPDPGTDEVLKWVTSRIAHGDAVSLKFVDGAQPGGQQGVAPEPRADG